MDFLSASIIHPAIGFWRDSVLPMVFEEIQYYLWDIPYLVVYTHCSIHVLLLSAVLFCARTSFVWHSWHTVKIGIFEKLKNKNLCSFRYSACPEKNIIWSSNNLKLKNHSNDEYEMIKIHRHSLTFFKIGHFGPH